MDERELIGDVLKSALLTLVTALVADPMGSTCPVWMANVDGFPVTMNEKGVYTPLVVVVWEPEHKQAIKDVIDITMQGRSDVGFLEGHADE